MSSARMLLLLLLLLTLLPPFASSSTYQHVDQLTLEALGLEIRSIKQNLSVALNELRNLDSFIPQLPWGNLTSSTVRCSLPYNWSQINTRRQEGSVKIGGLGLLMQIDRRRHVLRLRRGAGGLPPMGSRLAAPLDPGEVLYASVLRSIRVLIPSPLQQGPFQPDLAISNILAQLKALEQEIRSGGCGGSCASLQEMHQLLDQYYLEPGYLWNAGSFSQCSSLCGTGVAKRSVTCVSKLLAQVEDTRCSNRSKPLTEVPCVNHSQCSYEWEVGAYSECLTGCGQGLRRRSVSCRRSDGVTVELGKCLGTAPADEEVQRELNEGGRTCD
eukprot:521154-Hanusia_phi.AAC.5